MNLPFPWRYLDEDGDEHSLADVADVVTYVEFADDVDPPYECYDTDGTRLRLIVWALELVLCRPVPADYTPVNLTVREVTGPGGEVTLYEEYEGTVHRTLSAGTIGTGAVEAVEPSSWDGFTSPAPTAATPSATGVAEFHRRWMRARLGKRFS